MSLREWKSMTPEEWACNLGLYAIGVGIIPMGVVLTINVNLGAVYFPGRMAKYQYIPCHLYNRFSGGISGRFYQKGISETGDIYFVLFSGNIYGYVEDNSGAVQGTGLAASLLIMAAGAAAVAFAVACYIISVFPTNPTDDLVVALHERGMRLGTAKVSLDAVCVVLAFF